MKHLWLTQYILQGGVRWYANCAPSTRGRIAFVSIGQEHYSKSAPQTCTHRYAQLYFKTQKFTPMKQIVFLLLIAFIFISCSSSEKKNRIVTEEEFTDNGQSIDMEKVSTIQKLIIGRWLETDGDSNSVMTISKDSIIGGFSEDCWSKYKIEPEKNHLTKTKDGQFWFGLAFQRCKDNKSINEYFGNILVDSLYLRCHDGIDDGETVVFKRLK